MIKNLLIVILCLSPLFANSQMKYNSEEGFYWQKIIECPELTADEIYYMIKGDDIIGYATQISIDKPDEIVANIADIESCSKDLYSLSEIMGLSWAVQIGVQYKGRVIYEIQEGRYRITFDNIKFYEPDNIYRETPTSLEDIFVKKNGQIREAIYEKSKYCLDHTFTKQLVPTPRRKDNW